MYDVLPSFETHSFHLIFKAFKQMKTRREKKTHRGNDFTLFFQESVAHMSFFLPGYLKDSNSFPLFFFFIVFIIT